MDIDWFIELIAFFIVIIIFIAMALCPRYIDINRFIILLLILVYIIVIIGFVSLVIMQNEYDTIDAVCIGTMVVIHPFTILLALKRKRIKELSNTD